MRPNGSAFPAAPIYITEYQKWYSQGLRIVEQLLPDTYSEFRNFYLDERRKFMDQGTYGIADYISGIRPSVMSKESASNKALGYFHQQVSILETAEDRLDSVLTDISRSLHSEILDDERCLTQTLDVVVGVAACCGVTSLDEG
jgi:hypothetical protein